MEPLFNKVGDLQGNYIKRRIQHRCFPVNNMNLLRTPILKNICGKVLLVFCKNRNARLKLFWYWLGQKGYAVISCTFWRRVYNPLGEDRSSRSQVPYKKFYFEKIMKNQLGKENTCVSLFLIKTSADFSYSLQILLKRKLNTDVFLFFQGSFLRKPSGIAHVKRVPFSVRLNGGENFCHLKS